MSVNGDGRMIDGLKRMTFALLVGLVWLSLMTPSLSAQTSYPKEKVIPLLIDRIAKWMVWPASVGLEKGGSAPNLKMVIYGKHFFGKTLDISYSHPNKLIKGKPVKVSYVTSLKGIPLDCHLLYIAEDMSKRRLTRILEYLGDRPILTMANSDNFSRWGVHVNIVIERRQIVDTGTKVARTAPAPSLVINETAARNAGFLFTERLKKVLAKGSTLGKNVNPYFEYQDKSQRLGTLAEYVQWPEESRINDKSAPFNIQVLGQHPFDSFLDNIYRRTRILEKRVSIRYITRVSDIRDDTNILFVCRSEAGKLPEILKAVAGKPILTIGDTPDFGKNGIHINYFYDGAWLKFEVNRGALKQSKLGISYQVSTISRIKFVEAAQR